MPWTHIFLIANCILSNHDSFLLITSSIWAIFFIFWIFLSFFIGLFTRLVLAMGLPISRLVKMLFARREMRILMVGLDASGKTTILYKLKLGEIVTTIPTIGIVLSYSLDYLYSFSHIKAIFVPSNCFHKLYNYFCLLFSGFNLLELSLETQLFFFTFRPSWAWLGNSDFLKRSSKLNLVFDTVAI